MNYKEAIDLFITLRNTYTSINNILLDKKTFMQEEIKYNRFFSNRFEEERKKIQESQKKSEKEIDKIREILRKELATKFINPFLNQYINNIQDTLDRLKQEINNDEAIDADFIDLA